VLKVAIALKDLFQVVTGIRHVMLELVHFVFDPLQPAKRCQSGFVHSRPSFKMNVLGQQTQLQSARAHNFAAIWRFFLRDQAKDSRLACPVSSHQTDVFTRIDLQRCAAQDILSAEGFLNI
jgi:hypothetical protein